MENAQLEGSFLATLLQSVHQASTFYLAEEAGLNRRLQYFAEVLANPLSWLLQHVPLEEVAGEVTLKTVFQALRAEVNASCMHVKALEEFLRLCEDIDSLRKFSVLNYLAVTKIVKKHDKLSKIRLRDAVVPSVELQPFYKSTRLASTFTHAQCIASEIVAAATNSSVLAQSEDYQCCICIEVLNMPVVLSCAHRFCYGCLAKACFYDHHCPLCKKETDLDPANYQIDPVLTKFVNSHFVQTEEGKARSPVHNSSGSGSDCKYQLAPCCQPFGSLSSEASTRPSKEQAHENTSAKTVPTLESEVPTDQSSKSLTNSAQKEQEAEGIGTGEALFPPLHAVNPSAQHSVFMATASGIWDCSASSVSGEAGHLTTPLMQSALDMGMVCRQQPMAMVKNLVGGNCPANNLPQSSDFGTHAPRQGQGATAMVELQAVGQGHEVGQEAVAQYGLWTGSGRMAPEARQWDGAASAGVPTAVANLLVPSAASKRKRPVDALSHRDVSMAYLPPSNSASGPGASALSAQHFRSHSAVPAGPLQAGASKAAFPFHSGGMPPACNPFLGVIAPPFPTHSMAAVPAPSAPSVGVSRVNAPPAPTTSNGAPATTQPTRRRACSECHKAKSACEGEPCTRCTRLGRNCITLQRKQRRRRNEVPSQAPCQATSEMSASVPTLHTESKPAAPALESSIVLDRPAPSIAAAAVAGKVDSDFFSISTDELQAILLGL